MYCPIRNQVSEFLFTPNNQVFLKKECTIGKYLLRGQVRQKLGLSKNNNKEDKNFVAT